VKWLRNRSVACYHFKSNPTHVSTASLREDLDQVQQEMLYSKYSEVLGDMVDSSRKPITPAKPMKCKGFEEFVFVTLN
jgi:hypothetical protein